MKRVEGYASHFVVNKWWRNTIAQGFVLFRIYEKFYPRDEKWKISTLKLLKNIQIPPSALKLSSMCKLFCVCWQKLITIETLQNHKKIHTGEKLCSCKIFKITLLSLLAKIARKLLDIQRPLTVHAVLIQITSKTKKWIKKPLKCKCQQRMHARIETRINQVVNSKSVIRIWIHISKLVLMGSSELFKYAKGWVAEVRVRNRVPVQTGLKVTSS